ncbi:hypothetical protein ACJMK2_013654 [Sinanodonta woodiana]|uniref:Uncharacterized protein n=1 Tax=Sinanodonta woodiana TaxID=1069815 RepID=A0ABD3V199_SINWO
MITHSHLFKVYPTHKLWHPGGCCLHQMKLKKNKNKKRLVANEWRVQGKKKGQNRAQDTQEPMDTEISIENSTINEEINIPSLTNDLKMLSSKR